MTPAGRHTVFTRSGAHSSKNARQTGAPNHHQNTGSGEAPMVGTTQSPGYVPAETVTFVRDRLSGQTHRYVSVTGRGLAVRVEDLAELVAEIVTEYAALVEAERDALVEDLAWDLNAARREVA